MCTKTWKLIKGYEGRYRVSTHGDVVSTDFNKTGFTRTLKQRYFSRNMYVGLYHQGKLKQHRVNRLVGQAFLGLDIEDKKVFVIYKDKNTKNNNLDNLKLGTAQENTDQCIKDKRFITHKSRRLDPDYNEETQDILELFQLGMTGREIAEATGWSTSYISMIKNKKRRVYQINI